MNKFIDSTLENYRGSEYEKLLEGAKLFFQRKEILKPDNDRFII